MTMNNISFIENNCFGCRSCEQVCPKSCIYIKPSDEGFLYPIVDETACVSCGLCLKACPVQQTEFHRNSPRAVYAFKNKDTQDVMYSASGGAADIAAKVILNQRGVVYGAAYDESFVVRHIEVSNEQEKFKLQSSKYVQSDINDCYSRTKIALSSNRRVLFTGTPCQIAGLYAFLGGDSPNLFTIDLICHGVPSPKLFEKYMEFQRKDMGGDIIYYNFRSKEKRGWGTQYMIKTKTKAKTKSLFLDRYGKHFMEGDCYRESCYQCPYACIERVGDITVGDFWGILKSNPDFYSEKGVSSVFVNTDKGKKLFEQMGALAYVKKTTVEEALVKQGNLICPTHRPEIRDEFYNLIESDTFISGLKVGLCIKERLKSCIPKRIVAPLKRIMK